MRKLYLTFILIIFSTLAFAQYRFIDKQEFNLSGYYELKDVEIDRKTQDWMIVGNPNAAN